MMPIQWSEEEADRERDEMAVSCSLPASSSHEEITAEQGLLLRIVNPWLLVILEPWRRFVLPLRDTPASKDPEGRCQQEQGDQETDHPPEHHSAGCHGGRNRRNGHHHMHHGLCPPFRILFF